MPHLLKLPQNNWSYDKKSYPHPHILTKFGHLRDSVYHMVIGVIKKIAQHLEISIRQFLPTEDLYIAFLT